MGPEAVRKVKATTRPSHRAEQRNGFLQLM